MSRRKTGPERGRVLSDAAPGLPVKVVGNAARVGTTAWLGWYPSKAFARPDAQVEPLWGIGELAMEGYRIGFPGGKAGIRCAAIAGVGADGRLPCQCIRDIGYG